MNKVTRHFIVPAVATAVFFSIALMPAEVLGCRTRGLIAVSIAIAAGLLGIFAGVRAIIGRVRGDETSPLWMATALILAVPAGYIVLAAG